MQTQGNNFKKITSRFDKDAKVFDDIYSKDSGFNSWFNRSFRKPIFERFEIAMSAMSNLHDKKILDIGCGPGVYLVSLASRGANRLIGMDLSPEMIRIAKQRVHAHGVDNVCDLRVINFLEADFPEKLNYSIAMGVFDYLADPIPFLQKMKQVTSEKVIASFPGHSLIRKPLRKLRYILTGKGTVYFYNLQQLKALIHSVGFHSYEIVPIKTGSGFVLIAQP